MARSRNIKPSIMDNEELAELEPLTRLLFVYLWMLADREGRLEDRPKRIAAQALPYDRAADVGAMLDSLHKAGFIARYTADGIACIQIVAFSKHQNPHVREAASELPCMEQGVAKAVSEHNLGSAEASPRSPDSGFLIPDSGFLIEDTQPPAASPAAKPARKARKQKTPLPDDFSVSDRVVAWAQEHGFDRLDEHLAAFKRKATANGYAYASWDDAFMEAVREDWAKLRAVQRGGFTQTAEPPAPWYETKGGISRKAAALGLLPWNELEEQWPDYRARVIRLAKEKQPSAGLNLDQLAALAAQRQAA